MTDNEMIKELYEKVNKIYNALLDYQTEYCFNREDCKNCPFYIDNVCKRLDKIE